MTNARAELSGLSAQYMAYLTQHHYGAVPLTSRNINEQSVEVKINGKKVCLVVDTGCTETVLNAACARHLGLDVHDSGKKGSGVDGELKENTGIALIQSFTIGGYEINRTNRIEVLPNSIHNPFRYSDGLLGLDYMKLNAVILPVGGHGLLMKPGPTPAVSIADYMTRLGFNAVPLELGHQGLMLGGHLNGTPFRAVVDSGDSFTTFDKNFVRAALGHDLVYLNISSQSLNGESDDNYRFTPKMFDLGGFNIPPIMLMASKHAFLESKGVDALMGFDLLGAHRAVIDLGSDILWVK